MWVKSIDCLYCYLNMVFFIALLKRVSDMKKNDFLEQITKDHLISSIKNPKSLDLFLESKVGTGFLLTGNISSIKHYVDLLKSHHRFVFLHLEKIPGISYNLEGLKFVANYIKPSGIISTKNNVIQYAKKMNLITIQRLFLIDSDATYNGLKAIQENKPDAIEVMPGLIPSMVKELKNQLEIPIITGGLLQNKKQMMDAIENGAIAVSTGTPALWKEKLSSE